MVELTIDGHTVQMPEGSMVMHAVEQLAKYVPHFCYHKKLSIAANCRMCLVEVEKAPKPLPACATPVSQGMIVYTSSPKAKAAQEGVMEFMLINHPLDCPICDQGGECQLQDLAVGYGKTESRYTEDKRIVDTKDAGALISMEEMSRCIHCTRCVRFGQEVAGIMELGMLNRGEHAEITTFLGKGVESELSGNMIDLCPVGALTSKPFRYQARTWELSRRKGVSVHDSLGSNLTIQVKAGKVMRVLPLENDAINECWISDRDRFAYEGLNSDDRLTQPMVKRDGIWVAVSWEEALLEASVVLKAAARHSAALVHAMSSLEELHGVQNLLAGLGSKNINFNLRATDFSLDVARLGVPWLGLPIADVNRIDRALIIGSFLRKDQPLLAARLRAATQRGAEVMLVHAIDDNLLMPVKAKFITKPSMMLDGLAQIASAVAIHKNTTAPLVVTPNDAAKAIAASLCTGEKKVVWIGQFALNHIDAARITLLAHFIATQTGATLGTLVQEANAIGAYALGLNVQADLDTNQSNQSIVAEQLAINILYNLEPLLDCGRPPVFAEHVIAFTAYRSAVESYATVMLPITPMTEAGGTFINIEGRVQFMHPSAKPFAASKPGWKVLKVLAESLGCMGFSYETLEQAKDQALTAAGDVSKRLNNTVNINAINIKNIKTTENIRNIDLDMIHTPVLVTPKNSLERVIDIPAYSSDAIVRRAGSLQRTAESAFSTAKLNSATLTHLSLENNQLVTVTSLLGSVQLTIESDDTVPVDCIAISAARSETAVLGNQTLLTVEVK
ncbi:MAG: dehydrogenase subunit [Pseudomonadota bacterium]|jgi:NADH-quinone oxidoreductase subunit G